MKTETLPIIAKLEDLHKQATAERSHYYVASCCREAIAEIQRYEAALEQEMAWNRAQSSIRDALSRENKKWIAQCAALQSECDTLRADRDRINGLVKHGLSLVRDTRDGKEVWACFDVYPPKPASTNHPIPMFNGPRQAMDAALF